MKHTSLLFLAGAIALSGSASADADLSKLPPPSSQKGLTFEKDIKPLFEASCTGCHGENKQKGDLRLDSLAAVLKGGEDGKVVVPKKSKESALVVAISGLDEEKTMPPNRKPGRGGPGGPGGPGGERKGGGDRPQGGPGGPGGPGGFKMPKALTAEEVGRVRAWIDQGAK